MNRMQRKRRIARINKAKKAFKKPRAITRQDIERTAIMVEGSIASDREFVDEHSEKVISTKKWLFIFSALCVVFGFILFLGIDPGINRMAMVFLFCICLVLVIIQGEKHVLYRSRLTFWKRELRHNTESLNGIRLRLQQLA